MQKDYPYILISFGVASLFIILTWFELYDGVENKLLDMRFLNRGRIETRQDIATLDMDAKSLQQIGRWPWSRENTSLLLWRQKSMVWMLWHLIFFYRKTRAQA